MIVPIILDPENITREYFDKNKPSFELFRLALEKNLVLIFDKEEKLKEELNKNLIELNNPPSTNTLLFYNTFIDLIYKNHLKYILSESQFKEEDILDFAVKSHRDLKFMDSLLTNKKITKILDFETCKIEDIMDTNFYTYVQKYSKGLPKTIDKLENKDFEFEISKLLWKSNFLSIYDETITSPINFKFGVGFNYDSNKSAKEASKYLNSWVKTFEYTKQIILENIPKNMKFEFNIFTSIANQYKNWDLNKLSQYIKKIFKLKDEENLIFNIIIKIRPVQKLFLHDRFLKTNGILLNIGYGDYIDQDNNRKPTLWKLSVEHGLIYDFENL